MEVAKRRTVSGDVVFIETSLNGVNQSVMGNISRKVKRHHGVYPVMALALVLKTIPYEIEVGRSV
jgi:hypothetical protein